VIIEAIIECSSPQEAIWCASPQNGPQIEYEFVERPTGVQADFVPPYNATLRFLAMRALDGFRLEAALAEPSAQTPTSLECPRIASTDLDILFLCCKMSDGPPVSANHVVRLKEEGWRYRQAEGLSGLKVEDQLERHGLLDGEVARRGAIEDLVAVCGCALELLGPISCVRHETTGRDVPPGMVDRRQLVACHQVDDLSMVGIKPRGRQRQERVCSRSGERGKGRLEGTGIGHLHDVQLHPEGPCCPLRLVHPSGDEYTARGGEDAHPGDAWHGLLEQFQPFRDEVGLQIVHARDIPAGSCQARDESGLHRIAARQHHNRNRTGRVLRRADRARSQGDKDFIQKESGELSVRRE
jgi:hypothetical protein